MARPVLPSGRGRVVLTKTHKNWINNFLNSFNLTDLLITAIPSWPPQHWYPPPRFPFLLFLATCSHPIASPFPLFSATCSHPTASLSLLALTLVPIYNENFKKSNHHELRVSSNNLLLGYYHASIIKHVPHCYPVSYGTPGAGYCKWCILTREYAVVKCIIIHRWSVARGLRCLQNM